MNAIGGTRSAEGVAGMRQAYPYYVYDSEKVKMPRDVGLTAGGYPALPREGQLNLARHRRSSPTPVDHIGP